MTFHSGETDYDKLPYPDFLHPQTHPDRLATVATLFGHHPPSVKSAKVLELGCSNGLGLIAMAMSMPEASFLGVDLAKSRIQEGCEIVQQLALHNVQLRAQSFLDLGPQEGPFDYIIAHGLFSWLPPALREPLLQKIEELLSETGVAFVSYNTLPGWATRSAMGEAMRYFTQKDSSPMQRSKAAVQVLEDLAQRVPSGEWYQQSLQEEHKRLSQYDASYVFHEYMGEDNAPYFFHQWAALARRNGLAFLAEVENLAWMMPGAKNPPPGLDFIAQQQYIDFVVHRYFRQSLLTKATSSSLPTLDTNVLPALWVRSNVQYRGTASEQRNSQAAAFEFEGSGLVYEDSPLLKTALLHLQSRYPEAVETRHLLSHCRTAARWAASASEAHDQRKLSKLLLERYIHNDLELLTRPSPIANHKDGPVRASPLALYQLGKSEQVHGLFMNVIQLHSGAATVLKGLSKTSDLEALTELVAHELPSSDPEGRILEPNKDGVQRLLHYLARKGLLLRQPL